jgi:hypothetical protein
LDCPGHEPVENQPVTVYDYHGEYYTLAELHGDPAENGIGTVRRPRFNENVFITMEEFELLLDAVYQDMRLEDTPSVIDHLPGLIEILVNFLSTGDFNSEGRESFVRDVKELAGNRGYYETPFWNGPRGKDTNVCIEGHGCFLRSELNYIAQGMWGAQSGEPVWLTSLVADAWNWTQYDHPATPGEVYWVGVWVDIPPQ